MDIEKLRKNTNCNIPDCEIFNDTIVSISLLMFNQRCVRSPSLLRLPFSAAAFVYYCVRQIRRTHTIRVVSIVMPCDFRVCGWSRSQTTSLDLKRLASTSCFRVGLVMIDFGDRFWRKTLRISLKSLFLVRCFSQGK